MARTTVGVLRGGPSSEYELSLKTGAAMLYALPEDRYDVRDIFIDKRGIWHLRGSPMPPARTLQQVDVVLNALHGGMGEDGTVSRFLEMNAIPFTGSRADAAAASINKVRTHELFEKAGIPMPLFAAFTLSDKMNTARMAREVHAMFAPPYVVKAPREGASKGMRYARTILDLPNAIADVLDEYGSALVEQYVIGEHVAVGVIEGFRKQDIYVLPPAHVKLPQGDRMIENHHHHEGTLEFVVPSRFSSQEKQRIEQLAQMAHKALGMRHYSSMDFVRTPHSIVLLEVDSTPALYDGSPLAPMLRSVGSSVTEFLEHSINLARGSI